MSKSRQSDADFGIPTGYTLADHFDDSTMPIFAGLFKDHENIENKKVDDNTKKAAQNRLDLIDNLANKTGEEVVEFIKQYLTKNNQTLDNCMVYGTSLFNLACLYANTAAVKWLIENGAEDKVNEKNNNGWAPLHFLTSWPTSAIDDSTKLIAKMLVDAKADVNLPTEKTGRSPLMIAAARSTIDYDVAEFLLRNRATLRDASRELIADKMGKNIIALAGSEWPVRNGQYHVNYLKKIEITESKGTTSGALEQPERKGLKVAADSLPDATGAIEEFIKWADALEKKSSCR